LAAKIGMGTLEMVPPHKQSEAWFELSLDGHWWPKHSIRVDVLWVSAFFSIASLVAL